MDIGMLQRISAALGGSRRQCSGEGQPNSQTQLDLEVYKTFRQQEAGWLTMHAQYARNYMVVVGAVLAVCHSAGPLSHFRGQIGT